MGTQAVVSVVGPGRKTLLKVVVGCNGQQAYKFASAIPELEEMCSGTYDVNRVYGHALKLKFGCGACLVVMDGDDHANHGMEDELGPEYRENFENPEWNPRWERGDAEHTVIIERHATVLSEKEL